MAKRTGRKGRPSSRPPWLWIAGGVVVVALALIVWLPGMMSRGGGLPTEGERIADFTLNDSEGNPFNLAEAYRENELILVFYRGYG